MKNYYMCAIGPTAVATATCSIHLNEPNVYWLSRIEVLPEFRGMGYGSKVLDLVCADADHRLIDLKLYVAPDLKSPLQTVPITKWYESRGFESVESTPRLMLRKHKPAQFHHVTLFADTEGIAGT